MDLSQTELMCVFVFEANEKQRKTLFGRQVSVIFTDFTFSCLMTQQDLSSSSEAAVNSEPFSVVEK